MKKKYIITEEQDLKLKRRLETLNQYLKEVFSYVDPKEYNFHDYVEEVLWNLRDRFVNDGDKFELANEMAEYTRENLWKEIEIFYLSNQ